MKRTEMVDHIYEEITDMIVNRQYSNETDMEYYKRKADSLLAMIEGLGMLPPPFPYIEQLPEPYENTSCRAKLSDGTIETINIPTVAKIVEKHEWSDKYIE